MMCTVEPPPELCIVGQSKLIQARICRRHERTLTKEDYASMIGGELPFLEHELNQQLMNKLKVMCVCVGHCADCQCLGFTFVPPPLRLPCCMLTRRCRMQWLAV
jgi:hypothetical protein